MKTSSSDAPVGAAEAAAESAVQQSLGTIASAEATIKSAAEAVAATESVVRSANPAAPAADSPENVVACASRVIVASDSDVTAADEKMQSFPDPGGAANAGPAVPLA